MKPSPFTIASIALLAGCQVQASTLTRRPSTSGAPTAGAAGDAPAGADTSAPTAGGDYHPELAFVAGIRTPHPEIRLVNLAPDPDPQKDIPDDGELEAYCPDVSHGDYDHRPTSPNIPDLTGKTLEDALAVLETLGRYCVIVRERPSCDAPSGTPLVCNQSSQYLVDALDTNLPIELSLQTDVSGRGTATEEHRVPPLKDRSTDEVLADLAQRGFTNIEVIADAQCERGTVCWADPDPDTFQALTSSVILHVRK